MLVVYKMTAGNIASSAAAFENHAMRLPVAGLDLVSFKKRNRKKGDLLNIADRGRGYMQSICKAAIKRIVVILVLECSERNIIKALGVNAVQVAAVY